MKCPKCGGSTITGPVYDSRSDVLVYQCRRCGYRMERLPKDRSAA